MTTSTIFCCLLLATAGTIVSAQTSGTATGTLTVNGKASKLTYAQTLETEDWDMGPNHKLVKVTVTLVFLSDVPIGDLEDDFDLGARGKEGTLHGLRLKFNKKGELLSGKLYDKAFEGGTNNLFASRVRFEPKVFNGKLVSGKIGLEEPDDFSSVKYDFSATFSAPVLREPKPTIEGAGAAETAPAKAVQEFLQAKLAKDVPKLKKLLRKEFVEMLENPEGKDAVMGLLDQFYPVDEVKQLKIIRVFDFGNRAWVEGLSKRPSTSGGAPTDVTYRIRTVRVNGEWKVQPM
ncbi:MAG: nuclear transport factor 2 family protein [Terriglobia bacterium]